MRFFPDKFTMAFIITIFVASLFPIKGHYTEWFSLATTIMIGLMFFLYGVRLTHKAVVFGIMHWRLHLFVLISTFVLFPTLGLTASWFIPELSRLTFYPGILFLCVLPSTVQSSIAFTSIAGGNIPAAIVSASISNILGIFLTPMLIGLLFAVKGNGISFDVLRTVLLQLLVPFLLGQILQPWIGRFVSRQNKVLVLVDRGSIFMIVYLAFSEAMVAKLWSMISWHELAIVISVDLGLLILVLLITSYGSKWLGFSYKDQITIMFCGSKKSLVSGAAMANIIFAGRNSMSIILPLMIFHQIQLMVCTVLAKYYANRKLGGSIERSKS